MIYRQTKTAADKQYSQLYVLRPGYTGPTQCVSEQHCITSYPSFMCYVCWHEQMNFLEYMRKLNSCRQRNWTIQ